MLKKAISILSFFIFGLVVYYFYQNNPAKNETPFAVCMTKRIANIDCPGCGGQRAFHQLLNGNFIEAGKLNIFIYFFAPLLTYIFLSFALKPFDINLPDIDISTKNLGLILLLLLLFTLLRNLNF
jgi:hypothetical protein